MPQGRKTPLASYRSGMRQQAIVRVEVQGRKEDAGLVRNLANALIDPEREGDVRAYLRQRVGRARDLKAILAAAPLEAVDLERSRDTGRDIES